MACAICKTRRPRRFCPGVRGDICSLCCGTEREVTVECPLDCEYLREAHRHEKPAPVDFDKIPNREIEVSDKRLAECEELLRSVAVTLANAAIDTPGASDFDVREALDALLRTHRTLQSGIYYDSVPPNPLAAGIYRGVQNGIERFRREEARGTGSPRTRDSDVVTVLAFLQRVEYDRNNGRRRGRAFLALLRGAYPSAHPSAYPSAAGGLNAPTTSLLLP